MRAALRYTLAIALVTSITTPPAIAATKLTVGKSITTSDPEMAVDVGQAVGIFENHGLDLEIVNFAERMGR